MAENGESEQTGGKKPGFFGRICAYVLDACWREEAGACVGVARFGLNVRRFVSAVVKSYQGGSCGLHAAGLTYFSMLAVVPILCLLMVFAKTCGAGDFAREKINEQLDAMVVQIESGEKEAKAGKDASLQEKEIKQAEARKELAMQVRTFSNDMFDRINVFNVGTLGWLGFGMLLWTVVSSLGQVEASMNSIWKVRAPRSLLRRIMLYLFTAIVLPLLVALAMSMPILRVAKKVLDATLGATSYTKWAGDALIAVLDSRVFAICFMLVFATFTFAYVQKMLPNCSVRLQSALEGGLVTALCFWGWFNLCTRLGVGIAGSSALYGSFATIPIILGWIYTSWLIVLLGSCVTYAFDCVHCGKCPCAAQ